MGAVGQGGIVSSVCLQGLNAVSLGEALREGLWSRDPREVGKEPQPLQEELPQGGSSDSSVPQRGSRYQHGGPCAWTEDVGKGQAKAAS